jgi:hypothetical protein
MSDYFSRVGQQLEAAASRGAHRSMHSRLRPQRRSARLLAVLLLALLMTASALAATGVIPLGSPVELAKRPNPRVGSGVPAPGGSRLLPLTVADPEGGPPWGLRVVRTTRGLVCLQVGRVQDGRLGVLGIDGAFHDDGRFHPLPAEDLPNSLPGLGVGFSEVGENATCHLPGEAFSGDHIGFERSAGGPADTTHRPRRQLRDLYYGMLGPQALNVSYRAGAGELTQPVVAPVGAYLLVLPTSARDQLATGGGAMGTPGGLAPVAPLTAIAYRLGGEVCERRVLGRAPHPCPPPQSLYGPPSRVEVRALHEPVRVHLRVAGGIVSSAQVSFRAPFAVLGAAQSYLVQIPIGRCHGSGGGYAGMNTNRDIPAGTLVSQSIGYPFSNSCGGRRATIEVIYTANGRPAVPVGKALVEQPSGTRAEPRPPRRPPRG